METNHNYKLIEGIFNPSEAKKVLLDIINAKINYHNLDAFSNHIRFDAGILNSKSRVEELTKTRETIKALIEVADKNNMQLQINSQITITLIKDV